MTGGTLLLGSDTALKTGTSASARTDVDLNGGILDVNGTTQGDGTNSLGTLTLSADSTIKLTLADTTQALFFADYAGGSGFTLAINNWASVARSPGTAGRLYFRTTADFTEAELGQITFSGFSPGAMLIGSADYGDFMELVPVPEPGTGLAALLLVGIAFCSDRRRSRRTSPASC